MKKNVKMILLSLFISFAAIGTANAANHCGTYLHGKWGASSAIYVFKKDLEAKKNVTGKCPYFPHNDGEAVFIEFTSKTREAEWERYNGSIIGISGEIEYRDMGAGPKPVIWNPKIRRD